MNEMIGLIVGLLLVSIGGLRLAYLRILRCSEKLWRDHHFRDEEI